tara:strand:- start:483 stop:1514 length:1032 start_codon:yes stop_codon:yes gene_type:complete
MAVQWVTDPHSKKICFDYRLRILMKQYNAAIIGLGIMGRRMISNFAKHPSFNIASVWDPSGKSIEKTKADFPDIHFSETPEALMKEVQPDLLYIACPPEFHKQYALQAIYAKIPLYIEKPLGVDIAESESLVELLERKNHINAVNFVQASSEAIEKVQLLLNNNELGNIKGVDIILQYQQWPRVWQVEADWLRFKASGGYIREVLSHFIFVVERLFGTAKVNFSQPAYPDDPKLCETHLQAKLECGAISINIFGSSGGHGPDRQEITIWGTNKSVRISDFYFLEISEDDKWSRLVQHKVDPRSETLQRQLDNIIKLLEGHSQPLADARTALSVQKIIERLLII